MKFLSKKEKNRKSRHVYCEWNSLSNGGYNTGSVICEKDNFSRTLRKDEHYGYEDNNKIDYKNYCPCCGSNEHWYYLPPIARKPKNNSSTKIWKEFWIDLKNRRFNHPNTCR